MHYFFFFFSDAYNLCASRCVDDCRNNDVSIHIYPYSDGVYIYLRICACVVHRLYLFLMKKNVNLNVHFACVQWSACRISSLFLHLPRGERPKKNVWSQQDACESVVSSHVTKYSDLHTHLHAYAVSIIITLIDYKLAREEILNKKTPAKICSYSKPATIERQSDDRE